MKSRPIPTIEEMQRFIYDRLYDMELIPNMSSLDNHQITQLYARLVEVDAMFKDLAQIITFKKELEKDKSEYNPTRQEMIKFLETHGIIFSHMLQENLSYVTMYHIYDIFKKYELGRVSELSINLFKYGLVIIGIRTKETKQELLGKISFANVSDHDNQN